MKKILTTFLLACATLTGAYASKAITTPFQITLQDGTTVMAQIHGDEHFNFYTTTSGELLIFENNTWRMATEADKARLTKKQNAITARRKANEKIIATRPFPHVGNPKALVIMVDFKDQKFIYTKDDINKLLNGTEYDTSNGYHGYGSAAQYFNDCSNGKFRPKFDIVGPYHLQKNSSVYGQGDDDITSLIKDVCTVANNDVDFAQYDSDNDGYVDLVYIIYAGYSAQWGESKNPNAIWPKSGTGNYGTYDGKQVQRYGVNNELAFYPDVWKDMKVDQATFKPYLSGIGVFLHEMSHTMGLPDFYPTVNWTDITKYDNQSMEEWDLMDGGENTFNGFYPTPYTAWERELMGWTEKMDTLKNPANVTLTPLANGGKGLRVMNDNDATGNEYYILESITNKGWYAKMPGTGMLVTHINYDAASFANFSGPNNTAGSPRITVIPANGTIYSSYHYKEGIASQYAMDQKEVRNNWKGNTYPGTQNVTSLTNWKPFKGTMSKNITNIVQKSNGDVTFAFMGGVPVISFANKEMTSDGKTTVTNALNIQYPRSDGKTTYTSSNTAIATVDANGKVTGVDDGTVTITATYTYNGGKSKTTATYKVTIKFPVPVLTFAKSEIKTDAKTTVTNTLKITNTYADGKTTYKSSNTAVATVDANGNVKGVANGTATITATYTYRGGKKTVTATYKATIAIPTITLANSTIKMDGKTTVTNKVTIQNGWTDGKLSYKSSNTNVATIDSKGTITAKSSGTATITVTYTYNNGNTISKSFTVTVAIPTDITELTPNTQHPTPANIYTLDGRYVGTSKESLPSGIYIQKGKKFTK
ncbi:MAG: M6 family metalloprotease domain-containing protein [Prevotella sp.]|nr:M6 family metalloprotease domain-containing protein [Prevotella sp.]